MSVFEESKSYRPFKYPKLVEMAKKHQIDMHWSEAQVELQDDLRQYNSSDGLATKNVSHKVNKFIVDTVLCLFTELDKTVARGYTELLPYAKNNEVSNWFLAAGGREVIHQRAYALAAETFGFEEDDWIAFSDYVEMQDKIDVMTSPVGDLSEPLNFAKALAKLLLGEGIGLFAAFTVLLNFKRFGLLIGTNDINQWSLLDENEHVAGNILVLDAVRKDLTDSENEELNDYITEMVSRFVDAEVNFIDLLYDMGDPEDLTNNDLRGYIRYLGDLRMYQLGLIGSYAVGTNPIPWVEHMLSGKNHDNFFEKRVTDYSHAGLSGEINYDKYS
tara:strand:- start:846 stop:1835 length:990 start_codon:yes stop_codon:yes gene_type:complete